MHHILLPISQLFSNMKKVSDAGALPREEVYLASTVKPDHSQGARTSEYLIHTHLTVQPQMLACRETSLPRLQVSAPQALSPWLPWRSCKHRLAFPLPCKPVPKFKVRQDKHVGRPRALVLPDSSRGRTEKSASLPGRLPPSPSSFASNHGKFHTLGTFQGNGTTGYWHKAGDHKRNIDVYVTVR